MSVVTTASISVLNDESFGNKSASNHSASMATRKSLDDSDSDGTLYNGSDNSPSFTKNSPLCNNYSPVSSISTLNPIAFPTITNRIHSSVNKGSPAKRSNHFQGPMAILTPCSNSHPFEERRIPVPRGEERAVRFGRAVQRSQPSQNNAVFDCKVLSRNHAILWYEDGQFFIKDTRSSNGTFVNNHRLSSTAEESGPRLLHSGDILQLGVDIIDHAKNVACGCTICIVRLIDERGEEFDDDDEMSINERLPLNFMERLPTNCTLITHDKLFKLSQYMKEAQYREQLFTERLRNLESVLATTQDAAESGWQALINEERLLSRIENLENQLTIYKSKAMQLGISDEIQEQLHQLLEDRIKAELAAKDSLKKAEDQIYEANMKVHDMERFLQSMDENNQSLDRRNVELEEINKRQLADYDKLLHIYTETGKEIALLKEQLSAVKKSSATFSVTRIEPSTIAKDGMVENGSSEATSIAQNGTALKEKPAESPSSHSAIFYQEACVQTDPIVVQKLPQHAEAAKQEDVLKTSARPVVKRNSDAETQILLISMFPIAFLVGLLIVLPLTWFTSSPLVEKDTATAEPRPTISITGETTNDNLTEME